MSRATKCCAHCGREFFYYWRPDRPDRRYCGNECALHRATPAEVRFWRKVNKGIDPAGCWLWTGYRLPFGHGMINAGHGLVLVHRFSWEIHNGPIPTGLCVCHSCDNPPCVNPAHLFLGTQAENVTDQTMKLRAGKKLTPIEVRRMRRLGRAVDVPQLSERFGVSQVTVRLVLRGDTWKHVV